VGNLKLPHPTLSIISSSPLLFLSQYLSKFSLKSFLYNHEHVPFDLDTQFLRSFWSSGVSLHDVSAEVLKVVLCLRKSIVQGNHMASSYMGV